MNVLAIDTSTEYLSLAIMAGERIEAQDTYALQSHSQIILPHIDQLLKKVDLQLSDLNGIAFGEGPGSFTGLRIGCGVVQGLAYKNQLPVVMVSTLLTLAEQTNASRVIVAMDARMGEIYHAAYERGEGNKWIEVVSPNVCSPKAPPLLTHNEWVGVGSGWRIYQEALHQAYSNQLQTIEFETDVYPKATTILKLSREAFETHKTQDAREISPLYVRNKVALTSQERRSNNDKII